MSEYDSMDILPVVGAIANLAIKRNETRGFQQLIFEVHERIYNNTGRSPERADEELVSNTEYIDAIEGLMEDVDNGD